MDKFLRAAERQENKLLRAAEKHTKKRSYDKAIATYRKYLELNPDELRVHQKLAELFARIGDYEESKKCYLKVAEGFEAQGFLLKAVGALRVFLSMRPMDREVNAKLAHCFINLGLVGDAVAKLHVLAELDESEGELHVAIDRREEIRTHAPLDILNSLQLGELLVSVGKLEEAKAIFTEVLANVRGRSQSKGAVIRLAERLIKLGFGDIELLREVARTLLEQGDPSSALEWLERCQKIKENDLETLQLFTKLFKITGHEDRCRAVQNEINRIRATTKLPRRNEEELLTPRDSEDSQELTVRVVERAQLLPRHQPPVGSKPPPVPKDVKSSSAPSPPIPVEHSAPPPPEGGRISSFGPSRPLPIATPSRPSAGTPIPMGSRPPEPVPPPSKEPMLAPPSEALRSQVSSPPPSGFPLPELPHRAADPPPLPIGLSDDLFDFESAVAVPSDLEESSDEFLWDDEFDDHTNDGRASEFDTVPAPPVPAITPLPQPYVEEESVSVQVFDSVMPPPTPPPKPAAAAAEEVEVERLLNGARTLLEFEVLDKAIEVIEKALDLSPGSKEARELYKLALYRSGEASAREQLERRGSPRPQGQDNE